jgi:hypothetical protein
MLTFQKLQTSFIPYKAPLQELWSYPIYRARGSWELLQTGTVHWTDDNWASRERTDMGTKVHRTKVTPLVVRTPEHAA